MEDYENFEDWWADFEQECRDLGYKGPIDKEPFEDGWAIFENLATPTEAAKVFVAEMIDD